MNLYRSRRDKKISGLCGGLAESMNVDPTLLRLLVAVTTVFTGGTVILIYIVASIIVPKEQGTPPIFDNGYRPFSNAGYGDPKTPPYTRASNPAPTSNAPSSNIDEMMKDIEKKALQKENDQLRSELAKIKAQIESNNKGDV
jgi:phage shock protein C